eukprot:SAG31_NODE_20204_length_581_cov_0.850622_1_plen_40_part_01
MRRVDEMVDHFKRKAADTGHPSWISLMFDMLADRHGPGHC